VVLPNPFSAALCAPLISFLAPPLFHLIPPPCPSPSFCPFFALLCEIFVGINTIGLSPCSPFVLSPHATSRLVPHYPNVSLFFLLGCCVFPSYGLPPHAHFDFCILPPFWKRVLVPTRSPFFFFEFWFMTGN